MIDVACDLFHKGWNIVSLATPIMNMSSSVLVGGSENQCFHLFLFFFFFLLPGLQVQKDSLKSAVYC